MDFPGDWPQFWVKVESCCSINLWNHEEICDCDLISKTIFSMGVFDMLLEKIHASCIEIGAPLHTSIFSKALLYCIQCAKISEWLHIAVAVLCQAPHLVPLIMVLRHTFWQMWEPLLKILHYCQRLTHHELLIVFVDNDHWDKLYTLID